VQIINTNTATVTHLATVLFDDGDDLLADITRAGSFVFVRGSDSDNDLLGFNACTGQSMGSFNLDGVCRGVDHIEATGSRVITISEATSGAPPGVGGYVDIFQY
jgi:hypothetical protein